MNPALPFDEHGDEDHDRLRDHVAETSNAGIDGDAVVAELVMPFVTVATKNGPHHDASYAAGWEMGALYAELEYSLTPQLDRVIHTSNAPQADLIAMHHGYLAEINPTGHDGWSALRLTRTGVD